MSLTPKELRKYCKPLLKRKSFRLWQLNGLLDDEKKMSLNVAKAFANRASGADLMESLNHAPNSLREPILHEFEKLVRLSSQNGSADNARRELLNNIQRHLISNGVYAEFGYPSSAGLLLKSSLIEDTPAHFILNEPHNRSNIFCGRLTEGTNHMAIFVSGALGRLSEILDIWLYAPKTHDSSSDAFERKIVRTNKIELERWCERQDIPPELVPVQFAIYVISVRSSIERLRHLALRADEGDEFLRLAANMQLDSIIAHETAHKEENRANGSLRVPKDTKEILAYLLEAVYSRPEDAFLSLLNRNFDFEKIMPRLMSDLRKKGTMAYLEPSSYLSGWAQETLEEQFLAITGRGHSETIDVMKIRTAQTTDFLGADEMPFILKAIYNPSNYEPDSDA